MVSTRALIFHMSVPCDKTFLTVLKLFTLWPWPWCLTHLLKALTLAINFELYVHVLGLLYFTSVFIATRPFYVYQQIWPNVTLTLVFVVHFSSPELKPEVNFSDWTFSVVCPSVCLLDFYIFNFSRTAGHKSSLSNRGSELYKWRTNPFPKGK
jgi:hypothetical protein